MQEHDIEAIDLVVINLYPFEQTVARGASAEECVENIDIGGPSMIRSAAKNFHDVVVLTQAEDYALVMQQMREHNGCTNLSLRRNLSAKAFARTAAYDNAISQWFAGQEGEGGFPNRLQITANLKQALRYGENPHQRAAFYQTDIFDGCLANARQVQGKELSYNNINDTDAAWNLVQEFTAPSVAIIKHANPCGVASAENLVQAYKKALAADSKSAFGGIIAVNRSLDAQTAQEIAGLFAEVIIAPAADADALAILAEKKNLRVLLAGKNRGAGLANMRISTISGGLLLKQEDDCVCSEQELQVVSKKAPTEQQLQDLRFAFTVAKHLKSNALVLAKDLHTTGLGAGQMSRVDSVHMACRKSAESGLGPQGSVLASDAFFPFDDNVHAAAEAGITAIIQPGGSVRDEEVIAAADAHGIAMVFTGIRHFKH